MAQTLEHNEAITQVVPITVPSCDVDVTVIQQLDDEPNDVGGLTSAELKAKFDETNAAVKDYINGELIPAVVGADATEQARQEAEAERVSNEFERVSNENERESAETGRTSAESARASAESARASAETGRASAEAERVSAESGRVSAEQQRQQNETARQDLETGYVAQAAGSAAEAAGSATNAQSWAVGGTGTRSGEDTNNAKYWAEQAAGAVTGVTSFSGRSGAVTPQSGDYTAEQVGAIPSGEKGAANGVASLDSDGKVPTTQLPDTPTKLTSGSMNISATVNLGSYYYGSGSFGHHFTSGIYCIYSYITVSDGQELMLTLSSSNGRSLVLSSAEKKDNNSLANNAVLSGMFDLSNTEEGMINVVLLSKTSVTGKEFVYTIYKIA